jgi:hypothetical protein
LSSEILYLPYDAAALAGSTAVTIRSWISTKDIQSPVLHHLLLLLQLFDDLFYSLGDSVVILGTKLCVERRCWCSYV